MKYLWELDKFDSEIFGFKVAKINDLENGSVQDLISDLLKNNIKYATFRISSSKYSLINYLEKSGFVLVDGLISLALIKSEIHTEISTSEIRQANINDLEKLKYLTSELFLTSRVMNDSVIPRSKAKQFYVKWIENSVKAKIADSVMIYEEKGEILGYITLHRKGQIPLLGVSKEARGKGVGRKLVNAALMEFKSWGTEVVSVDTQIDNISALRLYQSSGFKISNSYLTFRWAENA